MAQPSGWPLGRKTNASDCKNQSLWNFYSRGQRDCGQVGGFVFAPALWSVSPAENQRVLRLWIALPSAASPIRRPT